ncbi:tubulin-specific chaperone C [Xylariaceae sp. FL1651]|nr:tubulin-specific chaperone C [Xylariaceae sp. FL1651]
MSTASFFIPFTPCPPLSAAALTSQQMADPKERFFRHFQAEITLIQDEIDTLATLSPVCGERQDGLNMVLAGISRLSNEVMDATDFIPSYDQRAYSQAIKALTEKLNETTEKLAPKSRFQFKSRTAKTPATQSQSAPDPRLRSPPGSDESKDVEKPDEHAVDTETHDAVQNSASPSKDYNEELARADPAGGVRKPSFSTAKNIVIFDHTGLHIILPSTASRATSSGSLTNLNRCIVDMTIPTSAGAPFAGLVLKNIKNSLIIAGHVAGPVHMTGLEDSVVVVAARQVRIHECRNVSLYLHCTSHPIIEDCSEMKFAPLPSFYAGDSHKSEFNQWDQVDDFKWLKSEASPNWRVLAEEERISNDVWENTVRGNASLSTNDILRQVVTQSS